MAVWRNFGFLMVIFLAGLQAIPAELYEAARLDGAGRWQQFRNVTLPLLRPTLLFGGGRDRASATCSCSRSRS